MFWLSTEPLNYFLIKRIFATQLNENKFINLIANIALYMNIYLDQLCIYTYTPFAYSQSFLCFYL